MGLKGTDPRVGRVPETFVTCDRGADGVALLRLDRPKMNALSTALLSQLADEVEALAADPPRAVVVWGGPRIFAAGADVTEFTVPDTGRPAPARAAEVGRAFRRALDGLAGLPVPSIAAVNGYALGGGCELALACDLRVAGDDARFGQPEILLGIIPGGGGTQRLPRLVGPSRAKDLILTGRQVRADEALSMGLVDRVVPAEGVEGAARELAGALASGPSAANALAKRAIDEGLKGALAAGLDLEQELFAESFGTPDAAVGVPSFLENGPGRARFR